MPWLNPLLLNYLAGLRNSADVIVPRWHNYPEPLHAVYSKTCLAAIEENLQLGQLKTISFYEQVNVRYVEREELAQFDPAGRSFSNINTPGELTAANDARE
jgi:molybdopterin-guanine dinucleotide biosynthesis protein A